MVLLKKDLQSHFRLAEIGEQKILSQLAIRSKAFWGYDSDFMDKATPELAVTHSSILARNVVVLDLDSKLLGFYELSNENGPEMTALFVEPNWIGKGIGKKLWLHALAKAKKWNWKSFKIIADPFAAEKFYVPMGCNKIGEISSPVGPNRSLPLLEY